MLHRGRLGITDDLRLDGTTTWANGDILIFTGTLENAGTLAITGDVDVWRAAGSHRSTIWPASDIVDAGGAVTVPVPR